MKTINFKEIAGKEFDGLPYYNGGWAKNITNIDKTKQNGYSLIGDFQKKEGDYMYKDGLYLICSIGGSRNNQEKNYILLKVIENEHSIIKILPNGKSDWAIKFWDEIEKNITQEKTLKQKAIEKINKMSDEELIIFLGK